VSEVSTIFALVNPLKYGKSLPAQLRDASGSHPVYGSSGMVGTHSAALTSGPTLIVGRKGNVGAIHYSTVPCWPIDTAYFVEAPAGHNLRYYKYLLESLNLKRLDRSTAIPGLSRDDYNAVEVVIAPMEQQDEIVAELEKQFSRLDEAVANLQRVKANLKRYKASVLKAAVEGRLVETEASLALREGRTFETGEQLLQRILDERRAKWSGRGKFKDPVPCLPVDGDLSVGWAWAAYSQLGDVTTGFTPPTGDAANFGGVTPFFKPTDLDAGDNVHIAREYLTEAGLQKGRKLSAGSVLVTCIGATIGKAGLAAVDCATNQQINSVSPMANCVDSRYLFWWTSSPKGQEQILDNSSATTLPILNKSKFEALSVALPPLAEQTRIVAEVDRHLSIVREVEAEVDTNLKRAKALRQATLAKAFQGDQRE
jgi:type I restriction enzyme S subunit